MSFGSIARLTPVVVNSTRNSEAAVAPYLLLHALQSNSTSLGTATVTAVVLKVVLKSTTSWGVQSSGTTTDSSARSADPWGRRASFRTAAPLQQLVEASLRKRTQ